MPQDQLQDSLPQIAQNSPVEEKPKTPFNWEKTLGSILLIFGLSIIVISVFLILNVLGGKRKPPQVFNIESPVINLPFQSLDLSKLEGSQLPPDILPQINQNTQQGFKLLPDEVYSSFINIGLFYMSMIFVSSAGAKIAGLGINLIKDIKVTVKESKFKS